MSFWRRLRGGERKSAPVDALIASALGDQMRDLGGRVSAEGAMRCTTVRACTALIAESVAGLPLHLYARGADGSKTRAANHPLYAVLHDQASDLESAFEWRRGMMADLLLHGRAFSFVNRLRGMVYELIRLPATSVTVERDADGTPRYRVTDANGSQRVYDRSEVFAIEALGGLAPVAAASEAIRLALLLETHGARLFGAGARPGGILETDKQLTPQVIERLKTSFENGFAGAANAGKTAILEDGLKFKPLTLNSVDAQYLELRKFQVEEIARAFRVPLHKIGQLDRATFSNIEHQALEFVTDCLMPWIKLLEGAIRRSLLTQEERGEYFAEFLVDDLLRGDIKSRYEAYSQGILNGILSPNEVRSRENLPPYDGGDEHRLPLNTAPAGSTPTA